MAIPMDSEGFSQPTQPATQNVVDPRRLGKQNSGFSDEDVADIICLLIPSSESAKAELDKIASQTTAHLTRHGDAANVNLDLDLDDDASDFQLAPEDTRERALILRLSANVKDPRQGFTFGRNQMRCDVHFAQDPHRRLSNIHFRIYVNEYGVLMLEDKSTNGTVVDECLLKGKAKNHTKNKRTLSSGSRIAILMHERTSDLVFLVRIPRRDGQYAEAYQKNLLAHRRRLRELDQRDQDPNATIVPGPGGHGNRNPPAQRPRPPSLERDITQEHVPQTVHIPKRWSGSDGYNRVGEIGRGAFATVYKVTTTFGGIPYAAKELDKRKFIKNGVLDQKVENEMKIMQSIEHTNIVKYIEHIDFDDRSLIIIMELVSGGDLGKRILETGPLSERNVQIMAKQLLGALGYLHGKNITHRDVKPDNILISSHEPLVVKLTDFGLSKMIDNEQTFLRTFCGTLLYCAPEVYTEFVEYDEMGRRNPRNRPRRPAVGQRYDHAVDIWSLGGVLFYALTGSPPYPVKTGVSYTELLYQIMTTHLGIKPLLEQGVSAQCIEFLRRMLDKRPETRATVDELLQHPWLGGRGYSFDEQPDMGEFEELDFNASQLSLAEKENRPLSPQSDDEILDDDDEIYDHNYFRPHETDKENITFGPGHQQDRLFGEVNVSAVGSSGAIPADRLNLPVPTDVSLGATEILGGRSEIRDSFESDASATPPQNSKPSQPIPGTSLLRVSLVSSSHSQSVTDSAYPIVMPGSQSLQGAESIMENLNMKSRAGSHQPSFFGDFNTSKRKPNYTTSDEFEDAERTRPSTKRLRSQGPSEQIPDSSSDEGDDYALFLNIPSIVGAQSGRQMDGPVLKSAWWNAQDKRSWHLRYPEMTQLQHGAFKAAADSRGEEFAPGKTPLWDLAMKHFPPVHHAEVIAQRSLVGGVVFKEGAPLEDLDIVPGSAYPSATGSPDSNADAIPNTQPPRPARIVPVTADPSGTRIVALLESAEGSAVRGVSLPVTESVMSWGRSSENTRVHPMGHDVMVPKYAFRLLLWKQGNDGSKKLRPWAGLPDNDESYHFYIASKASCGIHVNGVHLPPHDPKNPSGPCKHWMRLYDGDSIVFWQSEDVVAKAELTFQCSWGGSAQPRPAASPTPRVMGMTGRVPEAVARALDDAYKATEKKLRSQSEHDMKGEEAQQDAAERLRTIEREKERSRLFEQRRLEARRMLLTGNSRRTSPAKTLYDATQLSPDLGAGYSQTTTRLHG